MGGNHSSADPILTMLYSVPVLTCFAKMQCFPSNGLYELCTGSYQENKQVSFPITAATCAALRSELRSWLLSIDSAPGKRRSSRCSAEKRAGLTVLFLANIHAGGRPERPRANRTNRATA